MNTSAYTKKATRIFDAPKATHNLSGRTYIKEDEYGHAKKVMKYLKIVHEKDADYEVDSDEECNDSCETSCSSSD